MRKLIFLDIDGTIVDYEGNLPVSAEKAIHLAREAGNLVFICTGRSMAEVAPLIGMTAVDGVIGGGGTYIEDGGKVLFHEPLEKEQERKVVDWLRARGLEFYLETNSGLFVSDGFEEAALPAAEAYRDGLSEAGSRAAEAVAAFPPTIATMGTDTTKKPYPVTFPPFRAGEDLYRDDVNKISFIIEKADDTRDAKKAFPDLRVAEWGGKGGQPIFTEIAPGGLDKATAIRMVAEHRSASMADTVGIGDAGTDKAMLEACAEGVAMGNATEDVKEAADLVTADVNKDGLYRAFRKLGLILPAGEEKRDGGSNR